MVTHFGLEFTKLDFMELTLQKNMRLVSWMAKNTLVSSLLLTR